MRLRTGAASDVGRVRDHNEDAVLAEHPVYVVADGMGGHAAGEVASAIVVDTMRELLGGGPPEAGDVAAQVRRANERILASSREHPEQAGMGTTATGFAVVRDAGRERVAVLNVGDSRVYRRRAGALEQLTVDHSEVQELVEAGLLTREEAHHHPLRNIVTRSLGAFEDLEVDVRVLDPEPGDRFLACSDGLSDELGDDEIDAVLAAHEDADAAAAALVAAALDAGGRDNVTVVVLDVDATD